MNPQTVTVMQSGSGLEIPRYRVRVVTGPDQGSEIASNDGCVTIGTAEGASLRLTDPTVSRFHLEMRPAGRSVAVRDLGSKNGTLLGRMRIGDVQVDATVQLDLGRTRIELLFEDERGSLATSEARAFGSLIGGSPVMRALYSVLERAAKTTVPVLITGESGTGKELAARAVHDASPRAGELFEVVDCGGLPPTLAESELFGHERGAFTGANGEREGAFERAHGGTLFLDELGELPIDVQPKLLRALGEGEVRRIGGRRTRKVDVRIVAATNRDLRFAVNAGHFRADLFYRLAVVQVQMPPLRDRTDDLPELVKALIERIRRDRKIESNVSLDDESWVQILQHSWPGNVRELRNYLEQLIILQVRPASLGDGAEAVPAASSLLSGLERLPLRAAKAELLERFERQYLVSLLEDTKGNVAEAARRAGIDRVTLFRSIRRYQLKTGRE